MKMDQPIFKGPCDDPVANFSRSPRELKTRQST